MRVVSILALALTCAPAALAACAPHTRRFATPASAPAPPPTLVREVVDTYFGTTVIDPYRWMEAPGSQEFDSWLRRQGAHTRAVLADIKGRDALAARVQALAFDADEVQDFKLHGGRAFYLRRPVGANSARLYTRSGPSGAERLLVDPEKIAASDGHVTIEYFTPSVDGRFVAYGYSTGGRENTILRVVDVATGMPLGDVIDHAQIPSVSWLPDSKSFVYTRTAQLPDGAPLAATYENTVVHRHVLGTSQTEDTPILGRGVTPAVPIDVKDIPVVSALPDSNLVIAMIFHGSRPEVSLLVAARDEVLRGGARWREIADPTDAVVWYAVHGSDIYFLTHRGAPLFKVTRAPLATGTARDAVTVIAESQALIRDIAGARDALYVAESAGGIGRLRRYSPAEGTASAVPLPFDGALSGLSTSALDSGAAFKVESWLHAPQWLTYDPGAVKVVATGLPEPSRADFSAIESKEVAVRSADGTLVPLSIIYPREMKLDGSNPTWLRAYGAFGIAIEPAFHPMSLAWLERGGVIAVAHVRGGGEFGEPWHVAGMKGNKKKSVSDFIASANYLIEEGYTSRTRLAGSGNSAGGLVIGGVITGRPDLLSAAIIDVGCSNPLRTHLAVDGLSNTEEFGNAHIREEFPDVLAIDPYHHVRPGVAYPAVLLTAAINDTRVPPWEVGKMTARLQASTTSGRPVLLRVDFDAGHGTASATRAQRAAITADQYAFLFWQLLGEIPR
ncbi:MAG: prolyl oligopeptidase family serine peptidase [Minicystis sp.]